MRLIRRYPTAWALVAVASLLLAGCARIAPFSEVAYQQTINLKVDALTLMDKAVEPYDGHQADVERLMLAVEKAYEYARGRRDNEISAKQWEILKSTDGHLLGGFMRQWKEKGQLSPTFIKNMQGVVADAFDTISSLESGKPKAKSASGGGN